MRAMRVLTVGIAVFAVLSAFFWVVPNRSRFSSGSEFPCYDAFRDRSGEPTDEAALWPPGGKCVLRASGGAVIERPRQTPWLEWIGSAFLAGAIAAAIEAMRRSSRPRSSAT